MKMRKMKGWIGTRDTHLPTRLADAPQTARVGEIQDKEWDSPPLRRCDIQLTLCFDIRPSLSLYGTHRSSFSLWCPPSRSCHHLSWLSLNHSIHLNHSIPSDRHLIGPTNQSKGTQVQSMLFSVDPVGEECTLYTVCTQIRTFHIAHLSVIQIVMKEVSFGGRLKHVGFDRDAMYWAGEVYPTSWVVSAMELEEQLQYRFFRKIKL